MLIILKRAVVAAPTETVFCEQFVCKVVVVDLVFEFLCSVGISFACFWAYFVCAIAATLHIRIV